MIILASGLKDSMIVLEHLRNMEEELKDIPVSIGTFTNCRECGFTFLVMSKKGKAFTWCIYEHRNVDKIIINGKMGYISMNGDLPYASKTSQSYIASFSYNEHLECAYKLAELIREFYNDKTSIKEPKKTGK